jgi:hypothetical protein
MIRSVALPSALALLFAVTARSEVGEDGICRPTCTEDECVFEVSLDLYASETGLYQVRFAM